VPPKPAPPATSPAATPTAAKPPLTPEEIARLREEARKKAEAAKAAKQGGT